VRHLERLAQVHPILTVCLLVGLGLGVFALMWDGVDPGPQQITFHSSREVGR
jgi:hypothetical protein